MPNTIHHRDPRVTELAPSGAGLRVAVPTRYASGQLASPIPLSSLPLPRVLRTLLALAVLAGTLVWILGPCVPRVDLGPAVSVVGRTGADVVLIERPTGTPRWWAAPASARGAAAARPLPAGILGRPALAATGEIFGLVRNGLVRLELTADEVIQHEALSLPQVPGPLRLVGLDGGDAPVLADGQGRLHVRFDGAWTPLATEAAVAECADPSQIVLSPVGRVLAYPGAEGWTLWLWGPDGPRSLAAPGSGGEAAVFAPDGTCLVVEGRTDGLRRLMLSNGSLEFMALGNLGTSRRVPFSAGFRGDPPVLIAPQRDFEGIVHVFQTQVVNEMRVSLTTGGHHHYAPVVSLDGRSVAYLQAPFDEDGDDAIVESLYVHDFEKGHAVKCLKRRALPGPGRGPLFVGHSPVVALIADGRAILVRP